MSQLLFLLFLLLNFYVFIYSKVFLITRVIRKLSKPLTGTVIAGNPRRLAGTMNRMRFPEKKKNYQTITITRMTA